MLRLLVLLAAAFFSTSTCFEVDNTTDTLTVTISPKVWSLLETKASLISNAVTSIKIPDFSGEKKLLRYGIYNGRIEHFSIPKNGVSFKDINNGVHLSMRNVQLRASIRGRAEVGFKLFRKWRRIARFSGDIRVQSQNAHLEVTMNWNDFKFTPKIQIFMDLRIDFTHHLRLLNFFRGFIAKIVVAQVQKHVPKMVEELIITNLNPLLQTAKGKIVAVNLMNLNNFDKHWAMQWVVQRNILRIGVKPKR
ncbi:hypothetical protein OESDEN_07609 [Oesophagostomum dentatum]|uniref:Lipid-binding serum glycoprotein N-terminal domain-containing protein n=1 Tax=Oesophagostomum dentatum TaxID=61180 RepID=A0A0B1T9M4_OESDE|nr:hypothetical protein OESDEN_07609 [Oesophagostomum dentatum]